MGSKPLRIGTAVLPLPGSTPPSGPSRSSTSSAAKREHYGTRDRMRRGFSEPQGDPNRRRRGYHRGGLRPLRPFVSAPRMGGTEPGRLAPSSLGRHIVADKTRRGGGP